MVAASAGAGTALACTRTLPPRLGLATALRLAILVLAAYAALRACGVPPGLLWPWRWGGLADYLARGLDALNGLWPYAGEAPQARAAVMLVLPASILTASALAFWPGARHVQARTALAMSALLGLYLIGAMNESQVGWQVQGVLLLAVLCLWGWSWRARPLDSGRALAWMLAAAAIALALAAVLRSAAPLIDYRDWNPFGPAFPAVSFDWNQRYGPLPAYKSTEPMVAVQSSAPHLWRATTLDRFDGVRFVRSGEQPAAGTSAVLLARDSRWVTRTSFTVRGLSSAQLLSPGALLSVRVVGVAVPRLRPIAADGTITVAGAPPQSGDRYTVTAYAPQPSVAEMRDAARSFPAAYLPYTEFELPAGRFASAPVSSASQAGVRRIEDSPYAGVYSLARRLAAGAPSAYAVLARIEAFLRHGFTYDERPPQSAYPLVSFLLGDHVGYCQQFSGAMTLLLRMDGVPARVAAGFLSGARNRTTGTYEVSAQDAHAWVEVYFSDIGWVPFDPTPPKPRIGAPPASLAGLAGSSAAALRHRAAPRRSKPRGPHASLASRASGGPLSSGEALGLGLAGALGLALGGAWWLSAARTATALRGDARGAVHELSRALPRFGVQLDAATTLAELERRLARSHGPGASRYVGLLRERRYARAADPLRPSARDRRLLRRALCARRGPRVRLRALLALPPAAKAPRRSREASAEGETARS